MILSLPIPLLESIIKYLPTEDVVALSLCNSSLNYFCNLKLYRSILLTEDNLLKPISSPFAQRDDTILKKANLPNFLNSLNRNESLISLIQFVTIITSSSLTNSYSINDYEPLYRFLLSQSSTLRYLENLDYNNIKKCGSFLQFNADLISRRETEMESPYENDNMTLNTREYINQIANLENYQIGSLTDFELIPSNVHNLTKLSILIEQVYNERLDIDDLHLNGDLVENLRYLKTLELNSSISAELFLTKLFNMNSVKFANLETLSLTYVHSIRSRFDLILDNENVTRIFNFKSLKNLELKLNCDDVNCQSCFESFMVRLIPSLVNLVKLSLIYITNENLLANSRIDFDHNANHEANNYKLAWSNAIRNLRKLKKLQYLYLNLNDFTFIPFLRISNPTTARLINIFNFNVTHDYLARKSMNFNTIGSLPLKCLILPDFFYNWKIFDVSPEEIEFDLQFLSYLNKCDCEDCSEARQLFEVYTKSYDFTDNNKLLSAMSTSDSKHHFKFPVKSKSLSTVDVKNYRFFYNSFIRNLKQRLPYTDKIFKNQSGLTILEKPFNEFSLTGAVNEDIYTRREHYNQLIKLIIHNLLDDLEAFITLNRNLTRLVLGGIYFSIEKKSDSLYVFNGVYDEFSVTVEIGDDPTEAFHVMCLNSPIDFSV